MQKKVRKNVIKNENKAENKSKKLQTCLILWMVFQFLLLNLQIFDTNSILGNL